MSESRARLADGRDGNVGALPGDALGGLVQSCFCSHNFAFEPFPLDATAHKPLRTTTSMLLCSIAT